MSVTLLLDFGTSRDLEMSLIPDIYSNFSARHAGARVPDWIAGIPVSIHVGVGLAGHPLVRHYDVKERIEDGSFRNAAESEFQNSWTLKVRAVA